ncbi:MAG: hypothetical protein ABH843_03755 [Candidatus Omnitrophota bacterium]
MKKIITIILCIALLEAAVPADGFCLRPAAYRSTQVTYTGEPELGKQDAMAGYVNGKKNISALSKEGLQLIREKATEIVSHFTPPLSGTGKGIRKWEIRYYEHDSSHAKAYPYDALYLFISPKKASLHYKVSGYDYIGDSFTAFKVAGHSNGLEALQVRYLRKPISFNEFMAKSIRSFWNRANIDIANQYRQELLSRLIKKINYAAKYAEPACTIFREPEGPHTDIWKNKRTAIVCIDVDGKEIDVSWETDDQGEINFINKRSKTNYWENRIGIFLHGHPPKESSESLKQRLTLSEGDIVCIVDWAEWYRDSCIIPAIIYGIAAFRDKNTLVLRLYYLDGDIPKDFNPEDRESFLLTNCWFQDVHIIKEGKRVKVKQKSTLKKYQSIVLATFENERKVHQNSQDLLTAELSRDVGLSTTEEHSGLTEITPASALKFVFTAKIIASAA